MRMFTKQKTKGLAGVFAITRLGEPIAPGVFVNPYVDGIVIRTTWEDIEPARGQYNWSFIDSQLTTGKSAILIVLPGAYTPEWALDGVRTAAFRVKYGFSAGKSVVLPMPWDKVYLDRKSVV